MGLLPLDLAVRREDAGHRSWGPQAPHQDTDQPVRHREGQQAGVLPLGAKCSCVLQTGDNVAALDITHCPCDFVDVADAFVE